MSFRLFSTRIYISFYFVAAVALFLLTDSSGIALASAVCITIHELAHLITMKLLDCAPDEVRLVLGGINIIGHRFVTHKAQVFISLSGPASNFLMALIILMINYFAKSSALNIWMYISLILGIINLLPARGLDGGTALYSLLLARLKTKVADMTLMFTSIVTAISVISVFLAGVFQHSLNISFLLFALYLAAAYIMKL